MGRSLRKGAYVDPSLMKKVETASASGGGRPIQTWSRSSMVVPKMVGLRISVHNGMKHVPILVTENMVGHKLGEFVPTRLFRQHSGDRKTK